MAPTSRPLAPQRRSRLTTLPAEIRNQIYELLFRSPSQGDSNVVMLKSRSLQTSDHALPKSVLGLLLVCRQIHSEAEPMFYALNHLYYEATHQSFLIERSQHVPFIASLSRRRQTALTSITLSAHTANFALEDLKHLLPLATNLRVLYLEFTTIPWESDSYANFWAREVSRLLVTTKVKVVRIVHSADPKKPAGLGNGGSGNNYYHFISERAGMARAWDLSLKMESMLRAVVEE